MQWEHVNLVVFTKMRHKRAMMTLNCCPEFKGVIVPVVCVGQIQYESAWTLTKLKSSATCHAKWALNFMHLRQVVLKKRISIFSCVFLWFIPRTLRRIHFGPRIHGPWGHYLNKLGLGPQDKVTNQISCSSGEDNSGEDF